MGRYNSKDVCVVGRNGYDFLSTDVWMVVVYFYFVWLQICTKCIPVSYSVYTHTCQQGILLTTMFQGGACSYTFGSQVTLRAESSTLYDGILIRSIVCVVHGVYVDPDARARTDRERPCAVFPRDERLEPVE